MTPTSAALRDPSPAETESTASLPAGSLRLVAPAPPSAPYRGLDPFRYVDRDIFFEREDEVRKLVRLVTMYRGVLLYGESGAGKSSLINAGLVPAAIEEGFTPERLRVRPQHGEEIKVHRIRVREGEPAAFLPSLFADGPQAEERFCISIETLAERLMTLPADRRPLLIFDQFEELVTLFTVSQHDTREQTEAMQTAIATTLLKLLRHPDLPVKLLFVFREDYLAKIIKLFQLCPDLPDHHVRLTCPQLESVPRIIRGPFENAPARFERELSPELADKLKAALDERSECGTVNLSEVQIVCRELWESSEPDRLFERKGVQGVIDVHLSDALDSMPERLRDAAVALLARMLTGAGTRNIVSRDDLIDGLSREEATDPAVLHEALCVLEKDTRLVRREARNEVFFYEIVSEFLVPWIQKKRCEREAEAERRKLRQEHAKARRLLVGNIVWFGLAIVAGLLAVLLFRAMRDADRARELASQQEEIAHRRQLAAQAVQYVDDRVDLALLLGLEASRGEDPAAQSSLIAGLAASDTLYGLLRGHTGEVRSVAFSPDQETLATAGLDGTIQIWNVRSRHLARAPLKGHRDVIYTVSFSPDRQTLASGGGDGTILLWNVPSGQITRTLTPGLDDPVFDVVFSPDGRRLASAGMDGRIYLWDVATGQRLGTPFIGHGDREVNDLDFSRDGKYLASGGADETVVIWELASRSVVARLDGHESTVFSVAFSPDGKALASGLSDGKIFLWDLTSRPISAVLSSAHMNAVFGLAFDPGGRRLASGSSDKTISLWEVPGLKKMSTPLVGYASNAYSIAFHPGGGLLAAGLADGTVALWNVVSSNQPARDAQGSDSGKALSSSRVGYQLAGDGSSSATFSPAGDIVVAATGASMTLRAWKSATRESVPIHDTSTQIWKVAFSPAGGGTVATAGCWNWDRQAERCTRGAIQFWDAARWRTLGPPVAAHSGWSTIAFHPDGRTLVSAGREDGDVLFWDVAARKPVYVMPIPGHRIFAVAFSSDGRTLATATNKGLMLWDSAARRQIGETLDDNDPVLTAAFSPDGKRLAWAGRNSDISVWDIDSDRPLRRFSKHRSWVHSLAFSPDGRTLASGSMDRLIVLWDVESGEPKGLPLAASETVSAVAFGPKGDTLLSATYDGPVTLWELGIDTLRAGACEVAGRNLTRDEWRRYFGDEQYRQSCAQGPLLLADFESLAGSTASARDAFQEAVAVGLADRSPYVNNSICWWGSLDGAAATVIAACDLAVSLAESDARISVMGRGQIHDSRGVARAMLGDFKGAEEDFTFFLSNWKEGMGSEQYKRRESWIAALKQKRNPFDAETLQALRVE
jgi:WD40 repeat protein